MRRCLVVSGKSFPANIWLSHQLCGWGVTPGSCQAWPQESAPFSSTPGASHHRNSPLHLILILQENALSTSKMKTPITPSSQREKLGNKCLVRYNHTERSAEVNWPGVLNRGWVGINTAPPRTSAFSRRLTAGLSWHADPVLDLVALSRSQLLLFPAWELLPELPTLPSGLCHTHNAEDEWDEGGREYVEILWAASTSKTKKDGLGKLQLNFWLPLLFLCNAAHILFFVVLPFFSENNTQVFWGLLTSHLQFKSIIWVCPFSCYDARLGLSLNRFLSIFQSLEQCVIVQLTHLLDKSQIHSTKEKKHHRAIFSFPLMTSYGNMNLTSSHTNPGAHHLYAAMFFFLLESNWPN